MTVSSPGVQWVKPLLPRLMMINHPDHKKMQENIFHGYTKDIILEMQY